MLLCSLVDRCDWFGETYFLHLQEGIFFDCEGGSRFLRNVNVFLQTAHHLIPEASDFNVFFFWDKHVLPLISALQ